MKPPRLTRRSLARYLAVPALIGLNAQAQTPAASPVSTRVQDASRELAAVKLPRTTEPATRFEA